MRVLDVPRSPFIVNSLVGLLIAWPSRFCLHRVASKRGELKFAAVALEEATAREVEAVIFCDEMMLVQQACKEEALAAEHRRFEDVVHSL